MIRICLPIVNFLVLFLPVFGWEPVEPRKYITKHHSGFTSSANVEGLKSEKLTGFHLQEFSIDSLTDSGGGLAQLIDLAEKKIVYTPAWLQSYLSDFLRAKVPSEPFDCLAFVLRLFKVPTSKDNVFDARYWDARTFSADEGMEIGEIIILTNGKPNTEVSHVAVKYTETLFLSKAGLDADFILCAELGATRVLWDSTPSIVLRLKTHGQYLA